MPGLASQGPRYSRRPTNSPGAPVKDQLSPPDHTVSTGMQWVVFSGFFSNTPPHRFLKIPDDPSSGPGWHAPYPTHHIAQSDPV